MDAPKDNLVRATFERAEVGDGRTLTGYPVVFDTWTEINGWEGQFKERIAPGALNRTLRNNKSQVKVLFNHGMDPSIGDKPLGKPSVMRADDRGLYVEVPLSETSYNEDLISLLRDGAIDGMSFRFSVLDEEWNYPDKKNALPERTIKELRLYEVGPVTFPAYQATTVGVRSRDDFAEWRQRVDALVSAGYDPDTVTSEVLATRTTDDDTPVDTEDLAGSEGDHPAVTHRHRAAVAKARIAGAIK